MVSKEEKEEWILENCVDEDGAINLSDLEFPNHGVVLSRLKAKGISNFNQEARYINNKYQKAERIYNDYQKASLIKNNHQQARVIDNDSQQAREINNGNQVIAETKTPLQKRIDELQQILDELKQQANEDV